MSSGLAEAIARSLERARPNGQGWMACCPAHDDRTPSLSICDASGKVLVYCHAGCRQRAVIDALKKRGLWSGTSYSPRHRSSRGWSPKKRNHNQQDEQRTVVLAIWQSAAPAAGTLVERYLENPRPASADSTFDSLSSASQAPVGGLLALHGGSGGSGRRWHAARHPPRFPCR